MTAKQQWHRMVKDRRLTDWQAPLVIPVWDHLVDADKLVADQFSHVGNMVAGGKDTTSQPSETQQQGE